MELFKHPRSSFYYFTTTHPLTGKRVRRSTGIEATEANYKKALRAATLLASKLEDPEESKVTLQEAVRDYIQKCRAENKQSVEFYDRLERKLFGLSASFAGRWRLDPNRALDTLTKRDIEALKRARAAEGNGPAVIGHEIALLRAATIYAADQGYSAPNIRKWGAPRAPTKLRWLRPEEVNKLLAYLDPWRRAEARQAEQRGSWTRWYTYRPRQSEIDLYDMAVVLVMTGARIAEVHSMTRSQVDLTPGQETIRLWGWKTKKERVVPLTGLALEVLKRRATDPRFPTLLFPGRGNKVRHSPSDALGEAFNAAGLNEPEVVAQFGRATIHTLRHTYASWLRLAGVDLGDVQDLMGHANIATTKIYAKIRPQETLRRAAAALDTVARGIYG